MALVTPTLDDRDFHQLVEDARQIIRRSCSSWTDLSPGDPGMALVEVFAYMTELAIYKLNHLPENAYAEFLRLMGTHLMPPSAATTTLRFTLATPQAEAVQIPRGTEVATNRAGAGDEPVIFVTTRATSIPAGKTSAEAPACHTFWIEGELAGVGTGLPGQMVRAAKAPIIAPNQEETDLIVAVASDTSDKSLRQKTIPYERRPFEIWSEVPNFANLPADSKVYVVDRATGLIKFPPAIRLRKEDGSLTDVPTALAQVPGADREIRLWYGCGGGPGGNVAAATLTVMKHVIPGVNVTNPEPAVGGRAAETLDHALIRGPHEFFSQGRIVTERDFELAAESCGAVSRAKAFTKAAHWKHAVPGTVEVLLVPHLDAASLPNGRVTMEDLISHEIEDERQRIEAMLKSRSPLGTRCLVNWAKYKRVSVTARVNTYEQADSQQIKKYLEEKLHRRISPIPAGGSSRGWDFGQTLRRSTIYDTLLSEPGVAYVEDIRIRVDEAPSTDVQAIVSDPFEARTWYAGAGAVLFRSRNNGDSWEPSLRVPKEKIEAVASHPQRPGLLAVASTADGKSVSSVHVSMDCGQSWRLVSRTGFRVRDLAWRLQQTHPVLLLATDVGCYELSLQADASPVAVTVDPTKPNQGFYAIAVSDHGSGACVVALASKGSAGIFLSRNSGMSKSFAPIGQKGEDMRVLSIQREGVRRFLWAGAASQGNEEGTGCARWEILSDGDPADGWVRFDRDWTGGSCRDIKFKGAQALAATHHGGVLQLDGRKTDVPWSRPDLRNCGLPLRNEERLFQVIDSLAVDPSETVALAAGPSGVHRSVSGEPYVNISSAEYTERVLLPPDMLFCSGNHEILVESRHEV